MATQTRDIDNLLDQSEIFEIGEQQTNDLKTSFTSFDQYTTANIAS